jgi:hypothetical protein
LQQIASGWMMKTKTTTTERNSNVQKTLKKSGNLKILKKRNQNGSVMKPKRNERKNLGETELTRCSKQNLNQRDWTLNRSKQNQSQRRRTNIWNLCFQKILKERLACDAALVEDEVHHLHLPIKCSK